MKLDRIKDVADAVLYEGYILYPYRPSSIKNRQRWTFGGVFPKGFNRQGDSSLMETQVLVRSDGRAVFDAHVRFLQIVKREVGRLATPASKLPTEGEPALTLVPRLDVDGRELLAWEEAIEREVAIGGLRLDDLYGNASVTPFSFERTRDLEPVCARDGAVVAALIRTSRTIEGVIETKAQKLASDLWKLVIRIENVTPL